MLQNHKLETMQWVGGAWRGTHLLIIQYLLQVRVHDPQGLFFLLDVRVTHRAICMQVFCQPTMHIKNRGFPTVTFASYPDRKEV